MSEREPDLEARVAALERRKSDKDFWDKLSAASSAISGAVLGLVGLGLAYFVDHALEVRRFELASGEATRELHRILGDAGTTRKEKMVASAGLAAYGTAGLVPLMIELQSDIPERAAAAMAGIRSIALEHADAACEGLGRVAANRTRLYDWKTHGRTVRLLGRIDCQEYEPLLGSYQALLDGDGALERLRAVVAEDPEPTAESLTLLRGDVDAALALLVASREHESR